MRVSLKYVIRSAPYANGLYPIFLRVTHRRISKYISTSYSCKPSQWNSGSECFKGNYLNKAVRNRILLERKADAYKIIDNFQLKRQNFDFEMFKKRWLGNDSTQLVTYIEEQIQKYLANDQVSTSKIYEQMLAHLQAYKPNKVFIQDVRPKFIEGFGKYLEQRGQSNSTITFFLSALKRVFNTYLKEQKLPPEHSPFYDFSLAKYKAPRRSTAITEQELRLLEKYNPKSRKQYRYLQYFLFSVYARGINFKDMSLLKHTDINNNVLTYHRSKTKSKTTKTINITITPEMQSIIDYFKRQKDSYKDYIFPILLENYTTAVEVQKKINYTRTSCNAGLKKIGAAAGVNTNLSIYVARHTFANIMRQKGVSIEIISQMLGHSDIYVTQRYLASFGEDKLQEQAKKINDTSTGEGR